RGIGRVDVPTQTALNRLIRWGGVPGKQRDGGRGKQATVQHHLRKPGEVVPSRENSGMAGYAAHVARGGIVHRTAPRPSRGGVNCCRRDARHQSRSRLESSVAQTQWLEELLTRELIQRLAADAPDDFAQQFKVDVAIDKTLTGRTDGFLRERLAD